jgi:hypothetical protein
VLPVTEAMYAERLIEDDKTYLYYTKAAVEHIDAARKEQAWKKIAQELEFTDMRASSVQLNRSNLV